MPMKIRRREKKRVKRHELRQLVCISINMSYKKSVVILANSVLFIFLCMVYYSKVSKM